MSHWSCVRLLMAAVVLSSCNADAPSTVGEPSAVRSDVLPAEAPAEAPAEPPAEANAIGVTLEWIGHDESNTRRPPRLQLRNPTAKPVWVFCTNSLRSPVTVREFEVDGTWIDATLQGRCGNGVDLFQLDPGSSTDFNEYVELEEEQNPTRMRVGVVVHLGDERPVNWFENYTTVWSEAIGPEAFQHRKWGR